MMEVIGTDAVIDLVAGDADVAVRYAFDPPAGLVLPSFCATNFGQSPVRG
jgi:LysR family glycine cleavage system transcriptional activator